MAKPPSLNQKRYRGRLRSLMRSAGNHLVRLYDWHSFYIIRDQSIYPNQLAPADEIARLTDAIQLLQTWLNAKGPIPDARPAPAPAGGLPSQAVPDQTSSMLAR